MAKKRKRIMWNIDKVRDFVEGEEGNGCRLLSKMYINTHSNMQFVCGCGEIFETSFAKFNHRRKRQCNGCGVLQRAKKKMLSIEVVESYIKSKRCELVSDLFEGVNSPLKIKCACGDIFETNYNNFKYSGKNKCDKCTGYHRWSYTQVEDYVLINSSSKLISKEYVNNTSLLEFKCMCGMGFRTSFKNFQVGKRACDDCGRTFIDTTGLVLGRQSKRYKDVKHYIECESGSGCKLLSEEYTHGGDKLQLRCKCGEVFYTSYYSFFHSDTRRCKKCTSQLVSNIFRFKYKDVKNFINKESGSGCKLLSKEYYLAKDHIDIECKCGEVFTTSWDQFKGANKRQCNRCGWNNTSLHMSLSYEDVLSNIALHSGAKLITTKESYVNTRTSIEIECVCGATYETTYGSFINSKGQCSTCARIDIGNGNRKTTKQFNSEVVKLGQGEYVLLSRYGGAHEKVHIKHLECGNEYHVTPTSFLSGTRCPVCSVSKGELKVSDFLLMAQITYEREYTNERCKNERSLPFDFYLPKYNMLIEYDGEQHYRPVNFGGCSDEKALRSHESTKLNDNIKDQYCKDNGIPLLRIPYWEFDNIEEILKEWLTEQGVLKKCG